MAENNTNSTSGLTQFDRDWYNLPTDAEYFIAPGRNGGVANNLQTAPENTVFQFNADPNQFGLEGYGNQFIAQGGQLVPFFGDATQYGGAKSVYSQGIGNPYAEINKTKMSIRPLDFAIGRNGQTAEQSQAAYTAALNDSTTPRIIDGQTVSGEEALKMQEAARNPAKPAEVETWPGGINPNQAQNAGGLQFPSFDQALKDVYGKRSDLQELYNPDGTAKNPDDPRIAGIPTLQDWASKYGINEESTLKTAQSNEAGRNAPSSPTQLLQKGFQNAVSSGAAPQSAGEAKKAISQFTPAATTTPQLNAPSQIEQMLAQDPGYQQLLADRAEYNSIANQSKSLLDTYKQLTESAGIDKINADLLDMQRIIDGTEDDIRSEVQAVNGFATESQVMALAGARNKQLVKNYNNLLAVKQMAQDKVNTMVNLASQDRTFALDAVKEQLQIDQQIAQYRDKFTQNAKEGYGNLVNAIGFDGLYAALSQDPNSLALAEKTLGMPSGSLQVIAAKTQEDRMKAEQDIARQNAIQLGVSQPFYEVGGTVYRTSDGKAYSSSEEAFAEGVSRDWSNVQKVSGSSAKPIEVSPGATLFDPQTGQPIYTAPTAKQLSGGGSSGSSGSSGSAKPAKPVSSSIQTKYNIPSSVSQEDFDIVRDVILQAKNQFSDYYEAWGKVADWLGSQGYSAKDFDGLLWDLLHPAEGGLTGYDQWAIKNGKKSAPSTSKRDL